MDRKAASVMPKDGSILAGSASILLVRSSKAIRKLKLIKINKTEAHTLAYNATHTGRV